MLQTLGQLPELEEISLEVSWWRKILTDPSCIRNLSQIPSLKHLGNVTLDVLESMDDRRLSQITSLKVRLIQSRCLVTETTLGRRYRRSGSSRSLTKPSTTRSESPRTSSEIKLFCKGVAESAPSQQLISNTDWSAGGGYVIRDRSNANAIIGVLYKSSSLARTFRSCRFADLGRPHQRHRFHSTAHRWCHPQESDLQVPTQPSRNHFLLEGRQSARKYFDLFVSALVVSDHRYTTSTWYRLFETSKPCHWTDEQPRCMFM
jgi:hypothetical protein